MRYLKIYENFINDILISESVLVYSDRLINTLNEIGSEISSSILSLNNRDFPSSKICYVDLHDKNNLTFTTETEKGSKEQEIGIGRMLTKLLSLSGTNLLDRDKEAFVNKFKALMESDSDFKIFEGDDIYKFYSSIDYDKEEGIGQLGKSCMNKKPKNFFDLYTKNPDKVKLIVLFRDGKIVGRSLLWDTDNGFKFMDRIYTYLDSDIDLFKLYGDKMGYWYKKLQNTSYMSRDDFNYKFDIKNKNSIKNEDIIVTLDNFEFTHYPYLDSLCYFNSESGKLSNHRFAIDADLLICNMDGDHKRSDFEWVFN